MSGPTIVRDTKRYIVVMRDEDMWLEGPFESTEALRAAGEAAQAAGGDDPRWQEVALEDGHTALALLRSI